MRSLHIAFALLCRNRDRDKKCSQHNYIYHICIISDMNKYSLVLIKELSLNMYMLLSWFVHGRQLYNIQYRTVQCTEACTIRSILCTTVYTVQCTTSWVHWTLDGYSAQTWKTPIRATNARLHVYFVQCLNILLSISGTCLYTVGKL